MDTDTGGMDTDPGGIVACDSYLQDCPDTEKCNPYADDGGGAWNALGCFPVADSPGQPDELCEVVGGVVSGFDTCDAGTMCWDVDLETNIGTCISLCQGSAEVPTCPDSATTCIISNGGFLNICLPTCDPQGDDCPEGQECFEMDGEAVCVPEGMPSAGAPGTSCDNIASCNPGAICVTAAAHGPGCDGLGCCTETCNLKAPACENPNQVCQAFYEKGMAPPGQEDTGSCMVPM